MAITFLQLAQKVLREEKKPMSASEIWKSAQDKGYEKLVESKGKTPWATLSALIYVDLRDNPASEFTPDSDRPKRYILKDLVDPLSGKAPVIIVPPPVTPKNFSFLEKELHPLMVYFGFYYLKAYLKTINHTKSNKKGFGEWVHPDIAGCYFPFRDWDSEVVDVSTLMGNTAVKLYSFELKRELSSINLRESFFQAVSNSSWANEGYLVAAFIDTDDDFLSELKRLSAAFGIGVIQLDVDDPDSCEIMLPAKPKEAIDWDTVNKLSGMNTDFREYLKRVRTDINSREARKEMYDRVLEKDELVELFKKKVSP